MLRALAFGVPNATFLAFGVPNATFLAFGTQNTKKKNLPHQMFNILA